jgi:hypothetical protein
MTTSIIRVASSRAGLWILCILVSATPSLAQDESWWTPGDVDDGAEAGEASEDGDAARGIQRVSGGDSVPVEALGLQEMEPGSVKGRVIVDFAEVRAGPGAAYVSRGRVYRGDLVDVRRRAASTDWVEVAGGGVRGWVRADALEMSRAGAAAPLDAGRDRRKTNYTYDDAGRRVRPDGTPVGTDTDGSEPAPDGPSTRGDGGWWVSASVGAGRLHRAFESNIESPSALRSVTVSPYTAALAVEGGWDLMSWLSVRGTLRALLLGEETLPASEGFGITQALSVTGDGLELGVDGVGQYDLGRLRAGGYAGVRVVRQAWQETRPYPILLTNLYAGPALGGAVGVAALPETLDVELRGGVVIPLSVSQSPAESGGATSPFGYEVMGTATWHLTGPWSVIAGFSYTRIRTEFEGASTHADTETVADGEDPKRYDRARETDELTTFTAGVRWSPGR